MHVLTPGTARCALSARCKYRRNNHADPGWDGSKETADDKMLKKKKIARSCQKLPPPRRAFLSTALTEIETRLICPARPRWLPTHDSMFSLRLFNAVRIYERPITLLQTKNGAVDRGTPLETPSEQLKASPLQWDAPMVVGGFLATVAGRWLLIPRT